MEPTKKKYYPTTTTQPANSITSSTLNKIKAHNPKSVPKFNKPASNPPLVHTHLPPTFSTLSINVSSNSSLSNKTHHHHPKPIKQDTLSMEKQRKNKQKEKITEPIPRGSGGLSSEARVGVSGRRESFCYSQIKLGDFFTSLGVRILSGDMPPFMQTHAVSTARKAYDGLDKFSSRTLASSLKKEFDAVYGAAWHCIVGTSFGSFVTHSVGGFLYFSMDPKLYILLFKTTVVQISN